ncbi:TrmH family RNA methyltransferase [Microvirga arsenatis]|uniref:RNA methyltransferase n=1 Tax=Microvirga arsenatis TaxID=2692265 RepID=A0ABW9Z0P1_9HYPH|nr:RNA methyltransferase [Microvirga arsenatis]NBJ12294.1 RNA methyltransferase [Microvirga arsenatis]NBJ26085.1 RNA methyltransferase [Microvirga arsenatis]
MPILITDADDPRIEAYRAVRERDLVGRQNRFVAEGEVVLRVLVRQPRFEIESLLLAEGRAEGLADLLALLSPEVPVYSANRTVMDTIVGFPIHRGILAVAKRPPMPSAEALLDSLPARALVVGLIGLTNHDNVGGIFRNAAAFGADAVLLDRETCDPLYRKAIRVSVGGALVVPFARAASGIALMTALKAASFEVIALSPSGREVLSQVRPSRRTALLLGAEGPGLPEDVLAETRTVSIPMSGGFDSLNVATTSGIALHHLTRAEHDPAL